jgi:hypothetical protein
VECRTRIPPRQVLLLAYFDRQCTALLTISSVEFS